MNQKLTVLIAISIFFSSCNSNSANDSNEESIFGVYEADWMAIRYYLYPDSTFYYVTGETGLVNSEFDGPSTETTYSLMNPDGFGTYTVLREGENSILKFNFKQYRGLNMNMSSRQKIETNESFYSINEYQAKETFNKVGGINELLPK
jgi:hypothetical protein